MTDIIEAKLIVPEQDLWVSVERAYWNDTFESKTWNDALQMTPRELRPPVSAVKVGSIETVYRKGVVCRPLDAYVNFENKPILVEKV